MSRRDKCNLIRIIVAAAVFAAIKITDVLGYIPDIWWTELLLYIVPYAIIGWDIVRKAVLNIGHGEIFDENFLMVIATVGAFATGEYPEAVFVMLFYQVGELFQSIAVGKSRNSIKSLMELREDTAFAEKDGELYQIPCEEVKKGEIIVVKPGGKIPLDGVISEGSTCINTVALTGESLPRDVSEGDEVLSGCVNEGGLIKIKVTKEFGESTVSKILELVENSQANKSKSETFITRFSKYYTPAVVICAVLLGVLPPLIIGMRDSDVWRDWVYRAMNFLVISCPCALVISVPLSYFGGIGRASKSGVLVKGSNYLDMLSKCDTVVFDKTGTLTKGVFKVSGIYPENGIDEKSLIRIAAEAEKYSDHPISRSLKEYAAQINVLDKNIGLTDVTEVAGQGVIATQDGKKIYVGNEKLMRENNIEFNSGSDIGTTVYVARDGEYLGYIVISDEIKPDAADTVRFIKKLSGKKSRKVVMLTGDRESEAKRIAGQVGIDEYFCGLLPGDKLSAVEKLKNSDETSGVVFVGDGINDAPVLAGADVGIAMGALGADAAIEAADIVLMDDKLSGVSMAMKLSKSTKRIVAENIVFALAVKFIVLALSAFGKVGLNAAVFADVGVTVIAIINSMRTLRFKF